MEGTRAGVAGGGVEGGGEGDEGVEGGGEGDEGGKVERKSRVCYKLRISGLLWLFSSGSGCGMRS